MRLALKNIPVFLFILLLLIGAINSALAEEDKSAPDVYMADLINQARDNPLAMAVLVGKDPDQVIKDFPDKEIILKHGVPQIKVNKKIRAAALAHAEDMIKNQYYAHISPEGKNLADRLLEYGYAPDLTGEVLGMIFFNNLINSDDAVWAMFKNMYAKELTAEAQPKWNILNPAFTEMGVSVAKGRFQVDDRPFNVFMSVCDFASSETDLYAAVKRFHQTINRVRVNPSVIIDVIESSYNAIVNQLGREHDWKLYEGLPPLALDEALDNAAAEKLEKLFSGACEAGKSGIFFVENSNNEYLDQYGYAAENSRRVCIRKLVAPHVSPAEAAVGLLRKLIVSELASGRPVFAFGEDVTDVGIAIDYRNVLGANGKEMHEFLAVVEFARPIEKQSYLIGNLSASTILDEESAMIPKVGCPIELVYLGPKGGGAVSSQLQYTGPLGGYQAAVKKGLYQLNVVTVGGKVVHSEQILQENSTNRINNIIISGN